MEEKIVGLLEKYEDEIMRTTLGGATDEYNDRYAMVYKWEWKEHKSLIAYTLKRIINSNTLINSTGLAFLIIAEWSGVMTFSEGDLDIKGLEVVCGAILECIL